MLAIVAGFGHRLGYLEFGVPLGAPQGRTAFLRWVLDDYPHRRDEQWRYPPPEGTPVVQAILRESEEPSLIAAALLALGWYGLPESAPHVLRFVDHPDLPVRQAAVRALGQIGWVHTIPGIESMLADPTPEIRREALIALVKFGQAKLLPRIEAAAASQPDVAALVEQARRRARAIGAGDVPAMVEAAIESPEYEDLCVWVPFVWRQLLQMPPDERRAPEIRRRAARLLGLGQARKATRMLLSVLGAESAPLEVRIDCAAALARLGPPKAVEALIALLDVPELPLQKAVIAALGGTGSPLALLPLLERWDARDGALRDTIRTAVRELCSFPAATLLLSRWPWPDDPEEPPTAVVVDEDSWTAEHAADWVRAQLDRPERQARADAALVLALVGQRSDVERLTAMAVDDPDEEVRWLAAIATLRLSGVAH